MAKIFGVHPLELLRGADEQEFIKFFAEQYAPLIARLGWKGYVVKGDRGERKGKLALIWEIPSVEQRNRFAPVPDQLSEEGLRLLGPEFDVMNMKLDTYVTFVAGLTFTDYIVQGE